MNVVSLDSNRSGVRANGASEHFHQRAFACSIFSHDREDFMGVQLEPHSGKGLNAGVGF